MALGIWSNFHRIEKTCRNGTEFLNEIQNFQNYPLMLSGEGREYRYCSSTGLSGHEPGSPICVYIIVFPYPTAFSDALSVISATSTHGVAGCSEFMNHSPSSQISTSSLTSPVN
eukprot:COSAG02_NODE_4772_length_4994_cov_16.312768_6_plen_114_part_00